MKLKELIGKTIVDILVKYEPESYGLDKADCFLVLDNGLTIGIPFAIDDREVWTRELDKSAESLFKPYKWWQIPDKEKLSLKNSKIVDIISYPEETDKAFVLLDNNKLVTEITIAPVGLGHAGLWWYNSLTEVENKFGKSYIRLSDINNSI